jgi:amino acid permease
MNFFPIYKGLKDPTDNRMRQASLAGLTVTAIIYLIIGLMGYRIVGKTL